MEQLIDKYFGDSADYAKKIAYCESGGRANAHNYNPATGDDSYGVFQINLLGDLARNRPKPEFLLNAENNIAYAAQMHKAQGFAPWSCAKIVK